MGLHVFFFFENCNQFTFEIGSSSRYRLEMPNLDIDFCFYIFFSHFVKLFLSLSLSLGVHVRDQWAVKVIEQITIVSTLSKSLAEYFTK